MEKMKHWQSYVLIVVCVAINILGRNLASKVEIPFWFDAIGTLIAAIQLGPVGGAITGACLNLYMVAVTGDIPGFAYILVSIAIGVSVGIFFPKDNKLDAFAIIATAVFAGFIAVVISTPLDMLLYEGQTGNVWGDSLIVMLSQSLSVPWLCTLLGQAFVDIPDKALSVVIAVAVIQICKWGKRKFSGNKEVAALIILMLVTEAVAITALPDRVLAAGNQDAVDFSADYAAIGYDTEDGLATAEINAVAQTSDGYIWAGTYSGLYRYDGYKFEQMNLDERISNVTQFYVDSQGILWIGTNDSGIARYSPKDGSIKFYTTEDGLSNNAIRAMCEDGDGNLYIGTVTQLSLITADGQAKVFEEKEIMGVRNLSYSNGVVAGVSNWGELFFIKDQKLFGMTTMENENNVFYAAVSTADGEEFVVGTSSDFAVKVKLLEDGTVKTIKQIKTFGMEYFNRIMYSEKDGGYFYCCENGLGFIDKKDKVTGMSTDGFDSSISDVIMDYQGNVWFASNKQGIERYSWNPFQDVFAKAGLNPGVVNSLLLKDNILYVGMDNGLYGIDLNSNTLITMPKADKFNGVRVRHLMADSKGSIWVSTYGQDGLLELTSDNNLNIYNEGTAGTEGGRFRYALELSNGQILVASTIALNYIENGKVVKKLTEDMGLDTMILSLVEDENGNVLAGSDGDGVYIIKDGEIIDILNEEDGLGSPVVLKVVPCTGGYLFVGSNGIYYYDGNTVTKLNNFPYSNNYDAYITEDGNAWVISSAGIYVLNEKDLIANGDYNYELLNRSRGFFTTLTANANYAVDGDDLYFCCTDGVRKISLSTYNSFDNDYEIRISELFAGDEIINEENGVYTIPAIQGRIQFEVAVLNYTLSNPLVKIFLEGSRDEGIICHQNAMENLVYTNLPYGNYKLHVQILNPGDESVIKEAAFPIVKESQLYERTYFQMYLLTVCMLFIFFLGWLIGRIRKGFTNMKTWQKEATIDPMTGLLNKAASKRALTECCKTKKGILLMIDLDSFKLVNDLYGHDMGDKILIRFAEIIRSCIRENDIAGRMGGDEFIAYIHGSADESVVAEKAKYINEEIVKSAKEYMGEDMNIPLGASIGAVCAPEEGTEYEDLFGYADKALYNVKQNGKHGYAMYRKNNPRIADDENSQIMGIAGIRKILGERNEGKGAYKVDFAKLQAVYRTFVRLSKRTNARAWIVQFVLNPDEGKELTDDVVDLFYEILASTLRSNDVVAPNGKNQVLAVMTDIDPSNGQAPIDRVIKKWDEAPGHEGYTVTYETEAL